MRRSALSSKIVRVHSQPAIPSYGNVSSHRGRAQSRPSAASRRVAWTGGRDAISSERREWQAASAQLPLSKVLAPSPRFHSHFFSATKGCVPVGVRKSDGCCNLIADLVAAPISVRRRSAHYAQSPELGEPSQTQSRFKPLPLYHPYGRAKVRIPLPSPTACAAAPPVSERLPPAPVSSRFFHRARPTPTPSVVNHSPGQRDPERDARTVPVAFARMRRLPW